MVLHAETSPEKYFNLKVSLCVMQTWKITGNLFSVYWKTGWKIIRHSLQTNTFLRRCLCANFLHLTISTSRRTRRIGCKKNLKIFTTILQRLIMLVRRDMRLKIHMENGTARRTSPEKYFNLKVSLGVMQTWVKFSFRLLVTRQKIINHTLLTDEFL